MKTLFRIEKKHHMKHKERVSLGLSTADCFTWLTGIEQLRGYVSSMHVKSKKKDLEQLSWSWMDVSKPAGKSPQRVPS